MPLTNGFATPGRTLRHGDGNGGMGVSVLAKEVRQNDERYENIRDEKILQSMVRHSILIICTADVKSKRLSYFILGFLQRKPSRNITCQRKKC